MEKLLTTFCLATDVHLITSPLSVMATMTHQH